MKNSLIFAAILCLLYAFFLQYGPQPEKVITQSQWQDNRYTIEKYFRDSRAKINQHNIVYVGSSLTQRLEFDDSSQCAYNLSLGGESSLTGLNAIASSSDIPQLVFVEINVPERSSNKEIISKGSGFLPQLSTIFHVENMPMNHVLSMLHRPSKAKPAPEITEAKVNEEVLKNALALQLGNYQAPISSDILNRNLAEYMHLVKLIEAKGTKVIFFEMPIHPDLVNAPRSEQIRNAFKTTFPNHQLISSHELIGENTIRTVDGMHLSSSEARIVVRKLKYYWNNSCTNDHRPITKATVKFNEAHV